MTLPFPKYRGPFTADQLKPGDPYELSNGHPIRCFPAGSRLSRAKAACAALIRSDPDVDSVGINTGFSPEPGTLRAPDLAVGVSDEPGWIPGAPSLAIEFVDRDKDEAMLSRKIQDLLDAGTRWIWVVRLEGPHRVEVHSPDGMQRARPGEELTAPGILRNPVPVEIFFDRQAAERITFRNLLNRRGYENLEAVLAKGREEGREEGRASGRRQSLLELCEHRGLDLSDDQKDRVEACRDELQLKSWLLRATTASHADEVFEET